MKLIPGFRFHPTDVELVQYFLKRKVLGKKFPYDVIAELDIYKYPPCDLPGHALLKTGDLEWYFFCPRGKKYASGGRMNRATEGGYWKTTGKDRSIEHKKRVVGMIKTLVFHWGKAPKGERTDWVLHEFRLKDEELSDKGIPQDSYVICKVFQKDGPGPRNGAQYGKPFNEEEWDEEEESDCIESVTVAAISPPVPAQPILCHSSVVNDMHPSTSGCYGLTNVSCLSASMPSCSTHPSAPSNQVEDDVLAMLNSFEEDNISEKVDNPAQSNDAEGTLYFDPNDIFKDLGDLDSFVKLGEDGHGYSFGQEREYTTNEMLSTGDDLCFGYPLDFLELSDLETPLFQEGEYTTNEMLSTGDDLCFGDPLDFLELSDLETPLLWGD